ncbi:MAG: hypothetical protein J1E34_10230, partial [Oscillospiraceae bacterium]|nr:hypothetical protein [Oscillospiraceae bacterium]
MPGSAGGHSGGFSGGGHSGGFSGGGHSGSFGGGSHSGGFSGGIHTHSGGNRAPMGGMGGMGGGFYPHHNPGRGRNRGGGGCLTGILGIILIPVAVIFIGVFAAFNIFGNGGWFSSNAPSYNYSQSASEVSSELITYEKLSPELCTPIDDCVETDITGVLDEEGEAQIQKAIDYFYDTTGVQPLFLLLGGIDGNSSPDYEDIDSYLYMKYVTTFPNDEGHIIILMLLDGYDYETWYIIGDDAYFVTDDNACETILDYIDYYASSSTDVAEVIASAFTDSADDIMTYVQYNYDYSNNYNDDLDFDFNFDGISSAVYPRIAGIIPIVLIITGVIIIISISKKNKKYPRSGSQNPSSQGENPYRQVNTPNASTGSFNSSSHTPKRAAYPVRCPNCGATAYPKDDGTCEYCGSKLP